MADTDVITAVLLIAIILILGLIFAILQVSSQDRNRREGLAMDAVRATQSPEISRALHVVLALPPGISAGGVRSLGPGAQEAVDSVNYVFETLGWLVYRRVLPLHELDELMGGTIRGVWIRLQTYMQTRREELGNDGFGEWLQWLAERLEEHTHPAKRVGAHVAHSHWRP